MISHEVAKRVLAKAMRNGADLAEIYIEDTTRLRLGLDNNRLEQALRGADRGAGVRVFYGDLVTYAFTDDLSEESLLNAAEAAGAAGSGRGGKTVIDLTTQTSPLDYPFLKPFDTMSIADKAEILQHVNETARSFDGQVIQVGTSYREFSRKVWIFNSEGLAVEDDRNFTEFGVNVTAKKGDVIQSAGRSFGGQVGLELFDNNDPIQSAKLAAESAVKMLDARPAPAGQMTVVVCNGWGGVLFHEACGHQMEADFITKGQSAYTGKQGQRVANELISAIDDGTIPGRRGSLRFDDEGAPAQRNVLIDKGVLVDYMWDKVEARRVGREASTGNGRRESFRHMPMPRMTNTYIDAGPHDPQEIIESVEHGLYIKEMAGGQADISRGDYVFNATEAYIIENGKLTYPVRGATIAGNGPKTLEQIDMVGSDLALDPGQGMCGKGQSARVSVGQPTVRIPVANVGGTDA